MTVKNYFKVKKESFNSYLSQLNYKNVVYIFVLVATFVSQVCFGQMNNASDGSFGTGLNLSLTLVFFFGILILYGYLFYLAFINNIIKLDKKLATGIGLVLLFVLYEIIIVTTTNYKELAWTNPNNSIFPRRPVNSLDKLKSILDTFLTCMIVFDCFFLLVPLKDKKLVIYIISTLMIGTAVVCCLYSVITEFDNYIHVLKNFSFLSKGNRDYPINSFFYYSNVFGHVLYFASLNICLIAVVYKKPLLFLYNIFFFIFILFSGSRTAMLGFATLTFGFIIYLITFLYKNHKIIFTVCFEVLVFAVIYIFLDAYYFKIIKLPKGDDYVYLKDLFDLVFGTFQWRFGIIRDSFTSFGPLEFIFGVGIELNDIILRTSYNAGYEGAFNFHNGLFELLSAYGVVGLIALICVYYLLIRKSIRMIKVNKGYLAFILMTFFSYWLYQFGEAFPPFFNVFGGFVIGIFLFGIPKMLMDEELEINYNIEHLFLFRNLNTSYDI